MSFGSTGKRNANEPVLFPLPYFIPRLVLPTSPKSPDSFLSCIFKKKLFTELDIAFRQTGRSISELFKKVDTDGSHEIGADEFFKMF